MCEAVDEILKDDFSSSTSNTGDNTDEEDADIGLDPTIRWIFSWRSIVALRTRCLNREVWTTTRRSVVNSGMPPELLRRYEVVFEPRSDTEHLSIRQIGARHIGRLVKIRV